MIITFRIISNKIIKKMPEYGPQSCKERCQLVFDESNPQLSHLF